MADIHPLKLVNDAQGNPIALAEFEDGDTIPTRYLNFGDVDGGAISDSPADAIRSINGGLIADTPTADMKTYDGGTFS